MKIDWEKWKIIERKWLENETEFKTRNPRYFPFSLVFVVRNTQTDPNSSVQ